MSNQKKHSKAKIRKSKRRLGAERDQTLASKVSDKFEIENLARGYVFHLKLPSQKKVAALLEKYDVDFGYAHAREMSEWYRTLANEMNKRVTGTPIRVRLNAS